MNYTERTLIFEENKIYFIDEVNEEQQVMMNWEDGLMKKHADYVCTNGGDILEIGFGMGISANYIQQNNPASHTIVENHPQIIVKAKEWAQGKSNVTIIEGSWIDNLSQLSEYDGVFYDTYGDTDLDSFGEHLPSLVKEGGVATWWNSKGETENVFGIEGVAYEHVDISAPDNNYYIKNIYYLPQKQY
jgi:protein arginine N-methyltransferase 2